MTSRVVLDAPAKINLTLEVLGKRSDGYHEVRSVMQTIMLADGVTLAPAEELSLTLSGSPGRLAEEPPSANLAYRAAQLLREHSGSRSGADISLTKRVPISAGLGGGSSDAAAALRGLRELWRLDIADEDLARLATKLGSDVPFFIHGGAALASGRGEQIEALPYMPSRPLLIAWPQAPRPRDKTARMYAALRPEHYSDGRRTAGLAAHLRAGGAVGDEHLYNVFENVLPEVDSEAAHLLENAASLGIGRPHLCGSGPAFFFLPSPQQPVEPPLRALEQLGLDAVATRTSGEDAEA